MATTDEVEATLVGLIGRLGEIDPVYRSMLPSRRLVEARCPDLDLAYHATWRNGSLSAVSPGAAPRRPDIRVTVSSDDLVALAAGDLDFGRAYLTDRVRVDASVTDLLRLRAVL